MIARRLVSALAAVAVVCAAALAEAQDRQPAPAAYGPYPAGPVRPVPPPPTPMRRNSTGMMVAGIVMTAVGGAALATGLVVYMIDTRQVCASVQRTSGAADERSRSSARTRSPPRR